MFEFVLSWIYGTTTSTTSIITLKTVSCWWSITLRMVEQFNQRLKRNMCIYIYVRILKYFLLTSSKVTKHPHFFGSGEKTHKKINKNYSIDLKTPKKVVDLPKAAIHTFLVPLTCALMQLLRDGRLGDSWHSPLKPPSFSKPKVMSGEKWKNVIWINEQKNVCWGNSTKHQNSCQSFLGLN